MKSFILRGLNAPLRILLALTLAVTGMIALNVAPASADTGGGVSHVYLNVGDSGSAGQASQYSSFIGSLRNTVGHGYRGNTGQTQSYSGGLARVTLTLPSSNVTATLWITPQDLYVQGYSDNNGHNFVFSDTPEAVRLQIYAATGYQSVGRLSFSSDYNHMNQAAGRGRESMPISFADVRGSIYNLATESNPYGGNQRNVARSLMLMTQFTSESARLWDVFGVFADVMGNSGSRYSGLPTLQQYLENDWAALSRYGYDISNNPTIGGRHFNGVGDIYTWDGVARYLALMLGTFTLPQEGPSGDWWHTEL